MPSGEPVAVVLLERRYRNGSESRNLLPLWKEDGGTVPSGEPVAVALQERRHHNGTEKRVLLPLWKENEWVCGKNLR